MPDLQEHLTDIARETVSRAPVALILAAVAGGILWVGMALMQNADRERTALRADLTDLTEQLIQCHELRNASAHRDTKP